MTAPKYEIGARVGKLTLLHVLGTEHSHEGTDWVYRWQCDCGNIERIPERNIHRRTDCLTCSRIRNRAAAAKTAAPVVANAVDLPDGVPNFLTLPPPTSIKTGPERWRRLRYA